MAEETVLAAKKVRAYLRHPNWLTIHTDNDAQVTVDRNPTGEDRYAVELGDHALGDVVIYLSREQLVKLATDVVTLIAREVTQ